MITLYAELDFVMMVDVRIVTKTSVKPLRLNMVYDTGAGTTTISRQVALNAGYKVKKNDDLVDGVGGRVKADYTVIPDLILSGVSLGPVYAYVVDFHKELARKTEALLGMNVLSWFKVTQECLWNDALERYDKAVLTFEPKFDINEKTDINKFNPLIKGQRFGTSFVLNRSFEV